MACATFGSVQGVVPRDELQVQREERPAVIHTEFTWMETEELLMYVMNKEQTSSLERELAQRLMLAVDYIKELEGCEDDTRGQGQGESP